MFFGTAQPEFIIHRGETNIKALVEAVLPSACEVTPAEPFAWEAVEPEEEDTEEAGAENAPVGDAEERSEPDADSKATGAGVRRVIPQGMRNNTLHAVALRVLKRCGETEEAEDAFLQAAAACDPPLEESELEDIWRSALKYYRKVISVSADYIPPEEYASCMEWEEPVPFDDRPVPEFPLECLPAPIRNYAVAVAESTQTSPSMAGAIALAVMATCNQKKYYVHAKQDWKEPVNLFIMVVARPSERKSAVFSLMTEPLRRFEKEYNKKHKSRFEGDKIKAEALIKERDRLTKLLSEHKATNEDVDAITDKIDHFKPMNPIRLTADDVTQEKLSGLMKENNGCIAILSGEADVLGTLAKRYSSNPSMEIWLKGYSGEDFMADRVTRAPEEIESPALTVGLTTQPSLLADVMKDSQMNGRGLVARIMYFLPDSLVGRRNFDSRPVPDDVKKAYYACITNMLSSGSYKHPEAIELTDEALMLLRDYSNEIEKKITREYAGIEAWMGKCVGNTLRIAGNLQRADIELPSTDPFMEEDDSDELFEEAKEDRLAPFRIGSEAMSNAIRIMRVIISHAEKAYAVTGYDPVAGNAKLICKKIKEKGLTEFTKRQMMRYCSGSLARSEVMEPSLKLLEDNGYIAPKEAYGNAAKGRPSQRYLVNPRFLKQSA